MESENLARWMDFPVNHTHEVWMRRALELAKNGAGNVSPNPLVGCVIVHEGRIIGEGWHQRYGEPHAEVNAIADVADKSLLPECTLYVNLEPCSHTGKTPPCADLIAKHRLGKVVVANQDVNPLVKGKGIRKLRDAGIAVLSDVLADEGRALNRRFFTWMEKKRPHVILKWAETADGFIARRNYDSKWISDAYSRQLVHKWRAEEDAIMVASGTAWHDNPKLNVRDWTGRNPVRIVVDRYLKVGTNRHLFDGTQRTICFTTMQANSKPNVEYVLLKSDDIPGEVLQHLYRANIQSLIVEGGAQLLTSFIKAGLWDEARIFISPAKFGQGIPAPRISGTTVETKLLDHDRLRIVLQF